MIVGARVDFRLIHGQVGNLWANARQVSRFMVVDDQVAEDATQKQVLRMATPATCKLSVLPVEKAAANILAGKYDAQRLFIVVKKPEVYVKLAKAGVKFDEIILGNITSMNIVKTYNRNINCGQDDVDALNELASMGVPMVIQSSSPRRTARSPSGPRLSRGATR